MFSQESHIPDHKLVSATFEYLFSKTKHSGLNIDSIRMRKVIIQDLLWPAETSLPHTRRCCRPAKKQFSEVFVLVEAVKCPAELALSYASCPLIP